MTEKHWGGKINKLQVRQIARAITDEYQGRIDLSDLPRLPEEQLQQRFLSRALTALVARHLSGCCSDEAATSVIDGYDDQGIDAVVIDEATPQVWLIQTKWSDNGTASLTQDAAFKTAHGLHLILNSDYTKFNQRFQVLANRLDEAVVGNINAKITLVVALMGPDNVADAARMPLDEKCHEADASGQSIDIKVLGLRDFQGMVRSDLTEGKVDLPRVRLEGCGKVDEPYLAYYGSVPVEEIAQWYREHGGGLFGANIRRYLGLTSVNRALVTTLCTNPENFWYFNNGITMLCDRLERTPRWTTKVHGPGELDLTGASVVNGAQTVAAIHEAMESDPETAQRALAWVRVISLENCPEDFASEVTRATNTQNQVEPRDIAAALDSQQARLRDELAGLLGKTYVVKRGESAPVPEDGCTVLEAARALACAHPNPELAVRAHLDTDALWETGPQGAYSMLFHDRTSAYRVWRCVLLKRQVDERIREIYELLDGRQRTIAMQGTFVVAHLVFARLGPDRIDDHDFDWESEIRPRATDITTDTLRRLIPAVDAEFGANSYPVSTFKNVEKCRVLIARVQHELRGADQTSESTEYQPVARQREQRRTNAVHVLVDNSLISDGTPLELRPTTAVERRNLPQWVSENRSRGRATWVNDRAKPLLWEADGERYTPSGLVKVILAKTLANPSTSAQGTKYWFVPNEGSLVDIADRARIDDLM